MVRSLRLLRLLVLLAGGLGATLVVADEPTAEEKKLTAAVESKKGQAKVDEESTEPARLQVEFEAPKDVDLEPIRNSKLVTKLVIFDGSKITDRGLAVIKSLPNLHQLSLGKAKLVTSTAPAMFKSLKQLTHVHLGDCQLPDSLIESFKELDELREIDLSHTPVGDKAVAMLNEVEKLHYLNLSFTKVTDASLKSLAARPTLKLLDVQNTKVSTPAIKELESALKGVKVLR